MLCVGHQQGFGEFELQRAGGQLAGCQRVGHFALDVVAVELQGRHIHRHRQIAQPLRAPRLCIHAGAVQHPGAHFVDEA